MSSRDLIILGCSSQQPTRLRNHGAYLLRWNNQGFLFDPGEGTQRQFIFADVAPTVVNRIFISHFHGDHCLGLGSMLMRLNLDKVTHPIHCYYPASGKEYFKKLRYGTIYHEAIEVIEHPVDSEGIVDDDGFFEIEARKLDHGVDNLAWRIKEKDQRKFIPEELKKRGIRGELVKELEKKGYLELDGKRVSIDEVSWMRKGDIFAYVVDTRLCENAYKAAEGASMLLCESTYLEEHREMAKKNFHLTAKQAAGIAKKGNVNQLILTHYSARYRDVRLFEEEARSVFPNTYAADDFMRFAFEKRYS